MRLKCFTLDNVMLKVPVRHPSEVKKVNRYSCMKLCREAWGREKISKSSAQRENGNG